MSLKTILRNALDKTLGVKELKELLKNIDSKIEGNTVNIQGHWKLRTFSCFKLLLDSRSMVDATILKQGDWEADSWQALEKIVDQAPDYTKMFLDVGSYFGLYALKAFETKDFSRIVAFEADKVNASQLRANLLLNDLLSEIEIFEIFLSDSSGQKNMTVSSNWYSNRGMSGTEDYRATKRSLVESKTIDQVISEINQFIVMKVDVEGGELAVLNGARNLFAQNKVLLLIENMSNAIEQEKMLTGLGFNLVLNIPKDSNWIWKNFN